MTILGLNEQLSSEILWTGIAILSLYLFKAILLRILHARIPDTQSYYRVKRIVTYTTFFIGLVTISMIWLQTGASFGTYFGLFSAGLAVALKDLVINIAAWFFILLKRPFIVGDRIEIGGVKGDVIDQRVFQFSLMEIGNWVEDDQSTGRIIHVPNSRVFIEPLANYTIGFEYIWNEVPVLLTLSSDWRKAKTIFQTIANENALHLTEDVQKKVRHASKKYMIYYNYLTPTVYTSVKDSGIQLTIRYLCEPQNRRTTTERIWEAILTATNQHKDITLAYNTVHIELDH